MRLDQDKKHAVELMRVGRNRTFVRDAFSSVHFENPAAAVLKEVAVVSNSHHYQLKRNGMEEERKSTDRSVNLHEDRSRR